MTVRKAHQVYHNMYFSNINVGVKRNFLEGFSLEELCQIVLIHLDLNSAEQNSDWRLRFFFRCHELRFCIKVIPSVPSKYEFSSILQSENIVYYIIIPCFKPSFWSPGNWVLSQSSSKTLAISHVGNWRILNLLRHFLLHNSTCQLFPI